MKEVTTNYMIQGIADSKRYTSNSFNQPQEPDHTFFYLLAGVVVVAIMIKAMR